jgi:hypothetical protein
MSRRRGFHLINTPGPQAFLFLPRKEYSRWCLSGGGSISCIVSGDGDFDVQFRNQISSNSVSQMAIFWHMNRKLSNWMPTKLVYL